MASAFGAANDSGLAEISGRCSSSLGMVGESVFMGLNALLRTLATEFSRDKPGPLWTLHLLLTLSDRLSMALCTKPPMPFVGEIGRPEAVRPCIEAMRPNVPGSWPGELVVSGIGAPKRLPETASVRVRGVSLLFEDI